MATTMVPYLRCAFAETGFDVARQFMQDRVADGLDAEWLTGDEARSVCDWLSDEVEGACLTAIEPSVDSRLLTQSALKAAEMGGARLVDGEVVGIHPHPDPLPSRERGNASTPAPPSERGSTNPLPPIVGEGECKSPPPIVGEGECKPPAPIVGEGECKSPPP